MGEIWSSSSGEYRGEGDDEYFRVGDRRRRVSIDEETKYGPISGTLAKRKATT